ncbi:MAG: branched-chain amino acid transporter substrate-binding protein [Acidimicrobiales bacterium]|nr:branched-chain amino acid transporter substrate-binding protein [Acidimicrobiales bacterium]
MRTNSTLVRAVALGTALALAAAACGSSKKSASTTSATATTTAGGTTAGATTTSTTAAAPPVAPDQNGGRKTGGTSLVIGALLPQTGKLAQLGPPMIRGAQMAERDINAAGGVNGKPIKLIVKDDGGGNTDDIAKASADQLINNDKVAGIIGAAASGTTKSIIDKVTSSGTVECSPSNTGSDLTTHPDAGLYFRTAPPDNLQAQALAKAISDDGHQKVAVLAQNSDYGTGFVKFLKPDLEGAGAKVVNVTTYDPGGTSFDSEVGKVAAVKPDSIVLIGYPEDGGLVLKGMIQKSIGPKDVPIYVTDGMQSNTLYQAVDKANPAITKGIKGTAASAAPTNGAKFFPAAFKAFAPEVTSPIYSSQAYDCAVLMALAAQQAKSNAPYEIAKLMSEISKGKDSSATKCTTYKECVALIQKGTSINYDGASGALDFSAAGEPSAGQYDVYTFGADGKYTTTSSINVGK